MAENIQDVSIFDEKKMDDESIGISPEPKSIMNAVSNDNQLEIEKLNDEKKDMSSTLETMVYDPVSCAIFDATLGDRIDTTCRMVNNLQSQLVSMSEELKVLSQIVLSRNSPPSKSSNKKRKLEVNTPEDTPPPKKKNRSNLSSKVTESEITFDSFIETLGSTKPSSSNVPSIPNKEKKSTVSKKRVSKNESTAEAKKVEDDDTSLLSLSSGDEKLSKSKKSKSKAPSKRTPDDDNESKEAKITSKYETASTKSSTKVTSVSKGALSSDDDSSSLSSLESVDVKPKPKKPVSKKVTGNGNKSKVNKEKSKQRTSSTKSASKEVLSSDDDSSSLSSLESLDVKPKQKKSVSKKAPTKSINDNIPISQLLKMSKKPTKSKDKQGSKPVYKPNPNWPEELAALKKQLKPCGVLLERLSGSQILALMKRKEETPSEDEGAQVDSSGEKLIPDDESKGASVELSEESKEDCLNAESSCSQEVTEGISKDVIDPFKSGADVEDQSANENGAPGRTKSSLTADECGDDVLENIKENEESFEEEDTNETVGENADDCFTQNSPDKTL